MVQFYTKYQTKYPTRWDITKHDLLGILDGSWAIKPRIWVVIYGVVSLSFQDDRIVGKCHFVNASSMIFIILCVMICPIFHFP